MEPGKSSGLLFGLYTVSGFTQHLFAPPSVWRCWKTTSYISWTPCSVRGAHTERLQGSSEVEATFLPFCLSLLDSIAAMWGISTSLLLRNNFRDSSISIPLWSDFLSLGSQLWCPFSSFLGTWIKVTEAATSRSWFHMDLRDSSSWNLLW